MKDDITINNNPEACFTDGFDDKVRNNKIVQEIETNVLSFTEVMLDHNKQINGIKNSVNSCAVMLGKQGKRISELQNKQNDEIAGLKEWFKVLELRSEMDRKRIRILSDALDQELRTLKIFSGVMSVLFFISLIINITMQFVQ